MSFIFIAMLRKLSKRGKKINLFPLYLLLSILVVIMIKEAMFLTEYSYSPFIFLFSLLGSLLVACLIDLEKGNY